MTDIPRVYPEAKDTEQEPINIEVEKPKKKPDRSGIGGPSTESGKEKASGNLTTHGFYSNKFLPCHRCRYNKDSKLYDKQGECKEQRDIDRFSVQRCSLERKKFDELKAHYFKNYNLDESRTPEVEKMIMIQIRLGRLEAYLADEGLTQAVPVFNPKTGDTHWLNAQNVLKKDAYYDDKALRTWLESLQILKKTEQNTKLDIALKFTD